MHDDKVTYPRIRIVTFQNPVTCPVAERRVAIDIDEYHGITPTANEVRAMALTMISLAALTETRRV